MKYGHIISYALSRPWALEPRKLAAIQAFLELKAAGGDVDPEEVQAIAAAQPRPQGKSSGSVAVLPLYGILTQRGGVDMKTSESFTSVERWAAGLRGVAADPAVSAVVLEIDSPGGEVFGVAEAAKVVADLVAAGEKPIVAVANSLAASAAYWIGSQAAELSVTPGGQVGSIGVYGMHQDVSAMMEQAGVKTTFISAGKFKTEGNPFEPLSDEARVAMQERVDSYYGAFVAAVARGRGVTPADVRGGFGQGRVVDAQQAVKLGMADRVATLEETIARVSNPRNRIGRSKAEGNAELTVAQVCETFRCTPTEALRLGLIELVSVEPGKEEPAPSGESTRSRYYKWRVRSA